MRDNTELFFTQFSDTFTPWKFSTTALFLLGWFRKTFHDDITKKICYPGGWKLLSSAFNPCDLQIRVRGTHNCSEVFVFILHLSLYPFRLVSLTTRQSAGCKESHDSSPAGEHAKNSQGTTRVRSFVHSFRSPGLSREEGLYGLWFETKTAFDCTHSVRGLSKANARQPESQADVNIMSNVNGAKARSHQQSSVRYSTCSYPRTNRSPDFCRYPHIFPVSLLWVMEVDRNQFQSQRTVGHHEMRLFLWALKKPRRRNVTMLFLSFTSHLGFR